MRRGELYRVARPPARDPKRFRVFVVVSRQALIESRFSTIICAPVYSTRHGLATQVDVGLNEGLRHDSSVHCDELVSLRKSQLTRELAAGAIVSARTPSADRNPVVRIDAAIRSASGARVQHWSSLFHELVFPVPPRKFPVRPNKFPVPWRREFETETP